MGGGGWRNRGTDPDLVATQLLPGFKKRRKHSEIVASTLGSGPRGRRFKSSRPDHFLKKFAKFSQPGHSVFPSGLTVGTEWPVLRIQPSVEIVRDFSPSSLAASPSRAPSERKGYLSRYPASGDPALRV